jgi:hypothetical protein
MTGLSYRKLVVEPIVSECESAKSFWLVPAEGGQLDSDLALVWMKFPYGVRANWI